MQYFNLIPEHLLDELPGSFNNPFDYTPHPLCLFAKERLESSLPSPAQMKKGKMYGVLIVRNISGEVGFLVAYSGNEKETTTSFQFVPQVYDITNPNGYFRAEEQKLNKLNAAIAELKASPQLSELKQQLLRKEEVVKQTLQKCKEQNKINKATRANKRNSTDDKDIHQQLIKESQAEKSHFNKLKKHLKNELAVLSAQIETFKLKIDTLKKQRKAKSGEIQQQLFDNYVFVNANGARATATKIFKQFQNTLPPAGTGDCSAPKLLQYAFLNNYKAIAMAEFWWGPSPAKELRRHNYFYPACRSKCEPLLAFMLEGISIETKKSELPPPIKLLAEETSFIIINKPTGLLSVPGKSDDDSVYAQVKRKFANIEEPFIVHRLDRDTSGLMIITKTKNAYIHIQKQFLNQTVKKRYVAVIDGTVKDNCGTINLPLRVDIDDRPRQLVCYKHGKEALTNWEVIERTKNLTRIHFYPLTGRTHQLRVHSAHIKGLNSPIVGDPLYGKKSARLMLHAEVIEFIHPETHQKLTYRCSPDF